MNFAPAISAIISETHAHYWHLPDLVRERERQRRNAYMREYMRAYRKGKNPSLTVNISGEKRRRLNEAAKDAGYKPTPFCREAALAYLDRRIVLPKSFEKALATATLEIRKIGNSINQIAHHANIQRHASHRELDRANRLLEELQKTVERFTPLFPADDDR